MFRTSTTGQPERNFDKTEWREFAPHSDRDGCLAIDSDPISAIDARSVLQAGTKSL